MASRIYTGNDNDKECVDYRKEIHKIKPMDMIRYWKHDDWINDLETIFPIIAKGNIFEGIEAIF